MLKRIPLNFSPVHPIEDFFPHAFCMQIVNRYKNNEKMFSEKNSPRWEKKIPNRKAMNFSIFLWCMKNLILHCILHSLTFHSFHNVNLSKHEKCENRFENSSEFKMYSQLYEKKVLCFHFLIPSAFTLRFLWDNVLKHTHPHYEHAIHSQR